MSEPRRLLERTDNALEREILQAGTGYRIPADARARTLAALGLAGSVAVSTTATGKALSSLPAKLGWTKLATSAAFVAAALPAGYFAWQRYHAPLPTLPAQGKDTPQAEVRPSEQPAASDFSKVATPESLTAIPSASVARQPRAGAALTAELEALDAVRAALAQGDPGGALSLLDSYSRSYPQGRLELEAEVLRIDALARAGQSDVAKKRAEMFLKRHPKSVLASRVRGYL
jgi:hypothetical protein